VLAIRRERLATNGSSRGFVGTVSEAILLIYADRPNDAETREIFAADVMPHVA